MGVDFMEKVQRVASEDVKLMLWDTAGQEGFTSITRSYYKGALASLPATASMATQGLAQLLSIYKQWNT